MLLIGVLWGLNWPTVKFLLTEIPPVTIRALAFPLAALALAVAARVMGYRLRVPTSEIVPIVVTGFFVIFGFNILSALGQVMVETSRAAIIAYTMPAQTAVLAAIFLGERLGLRTIIALVLGMAGLGLLASEDLAALIREPLGPGIMALAALSWAIGNIALKARTWSTPPLVLTVWFFVVSTALAWLVLLITRPIGDLTGLHAWPSTAVLWTMAFHVLGPMVVCYLLWTVLIGRLGATVAAISTLTAPVVGVLSAVLLLGDPLSWQKLVSLSLVVLSIAITLVPQRRRVA